MADDENKLILSFSNQDESFAHGVEFGRILEKIERGDEFAKNNGFPIRMENVENVKNLCKQYNYIYMIGDEVDGWCEFSAIKNTNSDN